MRSLGRTLDKGLERIENAVLIVIMTALFCLVVLQIVARLIGHPPPWTEEVSRYLMVWLMFFGAAVCIRHNEHVGFLLLAESAGARARLILRLITRGLTLFFMGLLLVRGANWAVGLAVSGQTAITVPLPIFWVGLALPVAGLLGGFYALRHLVNPTVAESHLPSSAE